VLEVVRGHADARQLVVDRPLELAPHLEAAPTEREVDPAQPGVEDRTPRLHRRARALLQIVDELAQALLDQRDLVVERHSYVTSSR